MTDSTKDTSMTDEEAASLLIVISKTLSGQEKEPFSLHELAFHISDNQHFYQRLHCENIKRFALYRRAQFLSGAATIVTFGLYLLVYKKPTRPESITAASSEVTSKPVIILPDAVYVGQLTTGHMMKVMDRLVTQGFLTATGEYPGTVYYPTPKLWENTLR